MFFNKRSNESTYKDQTVKHMVIYCELPSWRQTHRCGADTPPRKVPCKSQLSLSNHRYAASLSLGNGETELIWGGVRRVWRNEKKHINDYFSAEGTNIRSSKRGEVTQPFKGGCSKHFQPKSTNAEVKGSLHAGNKCHMKNTGQRQRKSAHG